jgi:hypothetical protein
VEDGDWTKPEACPVTIATPVRPDTRVRHNGTKTSAQDKLLLFFIFTVFIVI